MDITSIVLSGGQGLRLGRNKALETISGESLIQRTVSKLNIFGGDIIVVTAAGRIHLGLKDQPRVRIVTDLYPGRGPLVGIYSGLLASDSFCNLVVACDMPFLNQGLLRFMVEVSAGFDIVVPRLGDNLEPLHAIYTKDCLKAIEEMFKEGNFRVNQLFKLVKARYLNAEEIDRFDPAHLSFFNINTEADLVRASDLIQKESHPDSLCSLSE